jgi:hypothetical protein
MEKHFEIWSCVVCKIQKPATAHQKRKKYCSKNCMAIEYKNRFKGENNANYKNSEIRICKVCQKEYKSYNKKRKYCSQDCFQAIGKDNVRFAAKKDNNHHIIVDALEKGGVVVKDTSKLMQGFPDLLVWHMKAWHLIEIKNPDTAYGKKGLSKSQKKFAENWQGGPVFIIRTSQDVEKFIIGEFDEIDQVGGVKMFDNV